jgi:acyl transferase domain-containing protein
MVFMTVPREIALVFPGQGAQQPRMGAGLYGDEPEFTGAMDAFFSACGEEGRRLRDDWLSERPGPEFDDCSRAQPLLFAVGYALAAAVIARGLRPKVVIGHSVGELTAAAIAGVFTIADGGQVMAARTIAMTETEPGGMLAVAAGVDRIHELLGDDLDAVGVAVGAINTPRQTVLSGGDAGLAKVEAQLLANGVACYRAKARQAFHSPLCAEAAIRFGELLRRIEFRPPVTTIRSTYTGRDVTDEEAVTPEFWAAQLARPVLFWSAMDDLLTSGSYVFLEAGPGGSCSAMLRRHSTVRSGTSILVPLLPALSEGDDRRVFEKAVSDGYSLNI